MSYKALMSDVDGTLIPYNYQAMPSEAVSDAIKKAQEYVTISLVTGRAFASIEKILKILSLSEGFAVVNNGAQVVDIATKEIISEVLIEESDVLFLLKYLTGKNIPFYLKQNTFRSTIKGEYHQSEDAVTKPYMIFTDERFTLDEVETIFHDLSHLSNLTLHKSHHVEPNKFGINITHVNATKLHGINTILEKTGIERDSVIGVGDGYNDFPLLMASGLKVAMGNAVDELKEIADYVIPSVDDDGIVDLVEKFIRTESIENRT